jgi:hypothetical protein
MWWTADKVAYRNRDDFVRAYQGSEMIWDKGSGNKIFYTSWDENIVTPHRMPSGLNIISNTYTPGVGGVMVFDDDITEFCEWMFSNVTDLRTIIIPPSVTGIRNYAFEYCNLEYIYLPASVVNWYPWAYIYAHIDNVDVDPNNPTFDSRNGCNAVMETATNELYLGTRNTVIPSGTTVIGGHSFQGRGISSITIPNSVTEIEVQAFYNAGLQSVTFESGSHLRYIRTSAFAVNNITSLFIPASVRSIEYDSFSRNDYLNSITVSSSNTYYDSRNNCNAVIRTSSNTLILGSGSTVIPSTVVKIDYMAFSNRKLLQSINIPASVTSISVPFGGCSGLTSITVDPNNTVYDSRDNCNAIIETATNALLYGCNNTFIPSGIVSILTFCGNPLLQSINIPASVTDIDRDAFNYCSGLTSITVDPNNTVYDSRDNCNAIIKTSSNTLFQGCTNTVIPYGITNIGDYSFESITLQNTITIPSTVTNIGRGSFRNTRGLVSITIPDSVSLIKGNAFQNSSDLVEVIENRLTPPTLASEGSDYIFGPNVIIRVPQEVVLVYKNSWRFYADQIVAK